MKNKLILELIFRVCLSVRLRLVTLHVKLINGVSGGDRRHLSDLTWWKETAE